VHRSIQCDRRRFRSLLHPELIDVEFVDLNDQWRDAWRQIRARGVVETRPGAPDTEVVLDPVQRAASLLVGPQPAKGRKAAGVTYVAVPLDRAAQVVEVVLHKLHVAPLFVLPDGKWRSVFEIVSPGLAENPHWQEIDALASVELNTRDPLRCDPKDLHLLRDVMRVIVAHTDDAGDGRGVTVLSSGQSLVVKVAPSRPIELSFGSAQVAEQARDAALHYLDGSEKR
jgi:hypothetical protein